MIAVDLEQLILLKRGGQRPPWLPSSQMASVACPSHLDFPNEVRVLVNRLKVAFETRTKNEHAIGSLESMAVMIQDAFDELSRSEKEQARFELPVLYSKRRGKELTSRCYILCMELMRLFEVREAVLHSPLWEDYLAEEQCSVEVKYLVSLLLYALVFATHRFVEHPENLWFSEEEQYFPLWKLMYASLILNEKDERLFALVALVGGIYADYTFTSFDTSRPECDMDQALLLVDHSLSRLVLFISRSQESATLSAAEITSEPTTAEVSGSDSSPPTGESFGLYPLEPKVEFFFLCRFLGCLEASPRKTDALRKALEESAPRILDVCRKCLRIAHLLSSRSLSGFTRLLATMFSFQNFARLFVENTDDLALLVKIPCGTASDPFVQQALGALLEPRFWTPGDPVGALVILHHHAAVLAAFSDLPANENLIHYLRQSSAPTYLVGYLREKRFFDPRRTAGKEIAVAACMEKIQTVRELACRVLLLMCTSPIVRQMFSRWSSFQSPELWERLMVDEQLTGIFLKFRQCLFPRGLPSLDAVKDSILHGNCLTQRILERSLHFDQWRHTQRADYQYVFNNLRTIGSIELPVRAGTGCSSIFVGPQDKKAILRTDTGHLVGVDMDSLQVTFMSFEDWYHKESTNIFKVPDEPHRFITTSTDLVSQDSTRKSHLWILEDNPARCRRLAEYENFQFLRPSPLRKNLGVGHSPMWRKRHGYYFTLDMEAQKRLALLGPLKDEEKHPNFPSFHSSSDIVIAMGAIWDLRSYDLVHRFDHFGSWGNTVDNVFHPNGVHVLINAEVWDLRNYGLLQQVEKLRNSRLYFNASGDVVYGKHAKNRYDELAIFDASDYSEIEYVPFPGYISDTCMDRYDYRLIVSYTAGFPVVIEIGGKDSYDA